MAITRLSGVSEVESTHCSFRIEVGFRKNYGVDEGIVLQIESQTTREYMRPVLSLEAAETLATIIMRYVKEESAP